MRLELSTRVAWLDLFAEKILQTGAINPVNQQKPAAPDANIISKNLFSHVVTLYQTIDEVFMSQPNNRELRAAIASGQLNWQNFLEQATGISINDLHSHYEKAVEANEKGDADAINSATNYLTSMVIPRLRFLAGGRTQKLVGELAKHHKLAEQLGHKAIGAKDADHLNAYFKTEVDSKTITSLKGKLQKGEIDKTTYDSKVAAIEKKRKVKFDKMNESRGDKGPIDPEHVTSLTHRMLVIHKMMNREQERMKAIYDKALAEMRAIEPLQKEYRLSKNTTPGLKTAYLSKRRTL